MYQQHVILAMVAIMMHIHDINVLNIFENGIDLFGVDGYSEITTFTNWITICLDSDSCLVKGDNNLPCDLELVQCIQYTVMQRSLPCLTVC